METEAEAQMTVANVWAEAEQARYCNGVIKALTPLMKQLFMTSS